MHHRGGFHQPGGQMTHPVDVSQCLSSATQCSCSDPTSSVTEVARKEPMQAPKVWASPHQDCPNYWQNQRLMLIPGYNTILQ